MRNLSLVVGFAFACGAAAAVWWLQPKDAQILIKDAVARPYELDGATMIGVAMTIENVGGPDRLLSVSSGDGAAELVGVLDPDGAPIPAESAPSLANDGAHVVLSGLDAPLEDGRLLPLTLSFANAGATTAKATLRLARPTDGGSMASAIDAHAAHGATAIDVGGPVPPAVTLDAAADGDGWRLRIGLENFRFAPEKVDAPHAAGEGHGHLYIGGLKIMRVTQDQVIVGRLPKGRHRLVLALYSNDHRQLFSDGEPIAAAVEIGAP